MKEVLVVLGCVTFLPKLGCLGLTYVLFEHKESVLLNGSDCFHCLENCLGAFLVEALGVWQGVCQGCGPELTPKESLLNGFLVWGPLLKFLGLSKVFFLTGGLYNPLLLLSESLGVLLSLAFVLSLTGLLSLCLLLSLNLLMSLNLLVLLSVVSLFLSKVPKVCLYAAHSLQEQ